MAYRLLFVLAMFFAGLALALFALHAFSYPIALSLAAVFPLGALAARRLPRRR